MRRMSCPSLVAITTSHLSIPLRLVSFAVMLLLTSTGSMLASVVSPGGLETVEGMNAIAGPLTAPNGARSQSLYSASDFPGPMSISGIGYRLDSGASRPLNITITDIQFTLSTFTATSLSATFADNVGSNELVVFNRQPLALVMSNGGSPNPFDLVVTFDIPFFYDPSIGDLLVDIRKFSSEFDSLNFDAESGTSVSTVYANTVDSQRGNTLTKVLVAEFYGVIIPEPTALSLLGFGALALVVGRRRRGRARGSGRLAQAQATQMNQKGEAGGAI